MYKTLRRNMNIGYIGMYIIKYRYYDVTKNCVGFVAMESSKRKAFVTSHLLSLIKLKQGLFSFLMR